MIHLALADVPVAADVRAVLAGTAGIHGCVVVGTDRVIAYGPACDYATAAEAASFNPDAHTVWDKGVRRNTRVQAALDLIALGATPNAAAKQIGIASSAVYRAATRRVGRGVCECCGQLKPRVDPLQA